MNILERFDAMEYGPAPESRKEADAWLSGRDFSKALFIDGAWRASSSANTFETSDPATGKVLAQRFRGGQDRC
jgi:aldehyde dehydrogenase (NAD+)